jgi:hypothetical protein
MSRFGFDTKLQRERALFFPIAEYDPVTFQT